MKEIKQRKRVMDWLLKEAKKGDFWYEYIKLYLESHMKTVKRKGQIQLSIATGMAIISFIAAPIIAYYSSMASTNVRIGEINTKEQVTESRVLELEKKIDRIELKLDQR